MMERPWIWLLVIVVCTFAVYTPSFRNGYTYDDRIFVKVPSANNLPNPMVAEIKPVADYWRTWYGEGVHKVGRGYRPLTVLSHALVQWWSPNSAGWQHFVNVVLHCLATVAVYWIVALFLGPGVPALVAAAVFGLHALHSDPVISMVGRAEILGFLMGAAALLLYVAALRPGADTRLLLLLPAGLCAFLAFSSKESAVSWAVFIPLAALALSWQGQRLRGPRHQAAAILAMVLPLVLWFWLRGIVLTELAEDPTHKVFAASYQANPLFHLPFWERASTGVMLLVFGLYKVLLPFHLACDYGAEVFEPVRSLADPRWLLSLLVVLGILIAGLWYGRRYPLLFLGMAVFLGFAFPVSNIPLPVETVFGERLYYTPALGLSFLLAWASQRIQPGRWSLVAGVLLAVWIGVGAVVVVQRCLVWRDNDTLFIEDVANQPDSVSMHMAVAAVYRKAEDLARWKHHLDRAHELNPELPLPLNDMGAYYYDQAIRARDPRERERNLATAEEWLWKGLRTTHYDLPDYAPNMYRQLAMVHVQRKQYGEAEKFFLEALRGNDREPDIKMDLGTLYFHTGRKQKAMHLWRQLTRDRPSYSKAWDRLLRIKVADGRDDEAIQLIREAEATLGSRPFLNVHRGLLEFRRGRFPQAMRYFQNGLPYVGEVAKRWEQWLCFGWVAWSVGDVATVTEVLRRVAPHLPSLPPAARSGFGDLESRLRHGR